MLDVPLRVNIEICSSSSLSSSSPDPIMPAARRAQAARPAAPRPCGAGDAGERRAVLHRRRPTGRANGPPRHTTRGSAAWIQRVLALSAALGSAQIGSNIALLEGFKLAPA